jgi:serine/threonine protein phosphatase PrpC
MTDAQRDGEEISAAADEERPHEGHEDEDGARSRSRIMVHCAGRTAVGQVRDHNEDNFVVANLGTGQIRPRDQVCEDEVSPRGVIFAVCDGMGGAAAGEVASQMAVDILVEAMRRGGAPKNRDALARRLVSAVEEAGRRIFDAAQKERSRRGMGTTSTVAVLVDKVMFLAEVGDSRAYLLRAGQLKQLTKDQSLVNQLIEAGHLTEDEAEAFEHSNIILQALGTSETVQVDLTFVELRKGDRLMMCSDGLSGLVGSDTLRSTLDQVKDPAECSAKLIEYAETAGGHDNITVVVADFDGDALADAGENDSFGYVQYPLPLSDDESGAFVDEDTTGPGERSRDAGRASDHDDHGDQDEAGGEGHAGEDEQDRDESLLPRSPEIDDPRANLLWVLGGLVALIVAGVVWFALEPAAVEVDDAQAHPVVPGPVRAEEQPGAQGENAAAAAESEEVEVNIHTDVEHATLLVNGEAKGELSPEQSRSLKLRPGAYRFEAQSAGNPVAVTVVTVRGDMPMDVFLELPKGASEGPTAVPAAAAQQDQAAPKPEAAPAAAPIVAKPAKPSSTELAAKPEHHHHHADAQKPAEAAPVAAQPKSPQPKAEPEPAVAPATSAPQPEHAQAPHPAAAVKPAAAPVLPSSAEASAKPGSPATAPAPKQAIPDNPF